MTICKHDKLARSCEICLLKQEIGILQERLDRVAAIVDVIEQHGDLDATTLTQLRQALSWVPDDLPDESTAYGIDCRSGRCEF
jgi:hypothetical protein